MQFRQINAACAGLVCGIVFAMLLLGGCYELTGECSPGPCADASVAKDGGGNGTDSSIVGSDSGGQTDASAVDAGADDGSVAQPETKSDTPIAKLCPPAKRPDATIEVAYKGETLCLSAFEKTAFELLDSSKGVPANSCADFGDPDYCFAEFALGPATEEGCFNVTLTYPQRPDAQKNPFTFQKCDAGTGLCDHKKVKDGWTVTNTLDVKSKLYTYTVFEPDGTKDTRPFKLVPKN